MLLAFWVGIPPARVVGMVRKLTVYGIALATTFAFFPDGADPSVAVARGPAVGKPEWPRNCCIDGGADRGRGSSPRR